MKTILSSILAGSLLATLAVAQSSRSAAFEKSAHEAAGQNTSTKNDPLVYVITAVSQFGTLDLRTGEFEPIPVSQGLADLGIGAGLIQRAGPCSVWHSQAISIRSTLLQAKCPWLARRD